MRSLHYEEVAPQNAFFSPILLCDHFCVEAVWTHAEVNIGTAEYKPLLGIREQPFAAGEQSSRNLSGS